MSDVSRFFNIISKYENIRYDFERKCIEALQNLLEERGLKSEADKVIEDVITETAQKYDVKFNVGVDIMEEFSEKELESVSGGMGADTSQWNTYCSDKLL